MFLFLRFSGRSYPSGIGSELAEDDGSRLRRDEPSSLLVCGHDVQCVDELAYLGSLIHSTCSIEPDIRRHCGMTQTAMQSLDRHL